MTSPRAQLTPHSAVSRVAITPRGTFAVLDAKPAPLSSATADAATADAGTAAADAAGGTAACAVLVPGFTGSKEDFAPLLSLLAGSGYRVLALDQRGQHETTGAAAADGLEAYRPDELAQDLLAVAAQLPGPVHLVGHSFGGLVARAAVIAAPAAFASLTLMSSGPAAIVGWRRAMIDALEPVLAGGGHEAVFAGMQSFTAQAAASGAAASSKYADADPALLAFLRSRFLATDVGSLAGMGGALRLEPDRVGELLAAAPTLPTMVVYGDRDDAWPPALQQDMARRLRAREVVLTGVGHSPAIDDPHLTAQTLASFWRTA